MPVTAKLSQAFYDRLGHQVADDMVDWFNQVDATYRADLRDLNELNFARFDARLEQRATEISARFDARLDQRFNELSTRIGDLSAKMDRQFIAFSAEIAHQQVVQLRWMMTGWIAVLAAMVGLSFHH